MLLSHLISRFVLTTKILSVSLMQKPQIKEQLGNKKMEILSDVSAQKDENI